MGYAINVFTVCNLFLTAQFIIKYLVMNHCKCSPVKGLNANISVRKTKCIFSFCEICVICAGSSFSHSKCTIKQHSGAKLEEVVLQVFLNVKMALIFQHLPCYHNSCVFPQMGHILTFSSVQTSVF